MNLYEKSNPLDELKELYPQKFVSEKYVFRNIKRGNKVFIGTGAGEPRYLVRSLMDFLNKNPTAFFDVDIYYVWTLPDDSNYFYKKYQQNFRIASCFIGDLNREAINKGDADFTPIFTSRIPEMFDRNYFPIDIALIQNITG